MQLAGASHGEVVQEHQDAGSQPRRKRFAGKSRKQRAPLAESIRDLDHAIAELQTARDELARVPEDLDRRDRLRACAEPMARLGLVERYCASLRKRHGGG